jgi:hypothetical protein
MRRSARKQCAANSGYWTREAQSAFRRRSQRDESVLETKALLV